MITAATPRSCAGGVAPPASDPEEPALPCAGLELAMTVLTLLAAPGGAFCQERTALRAWRLAVAQALTLGGRTISRLIASLQRDGRDWSADYRLFSRSPWQARMLFTPVLREAIAAALPPQGAPDALLWVAGDHTHVRKSGRQIAGVQTMRDPMSPPWHVNLMSGLRFFHLALVLSPWRREGGEGADIPARAIPVRFEPSPFVRKPGKKATAEALAAYKKALRARL